MTDLRFYFDGTNGTPVNGEVLLDVMISKEEKPKDIGQLKFRYSDSFSCTRPAPTTMSLR